MGIMEIQYQTKEKPPKQCSFCEEESQFLMAKPTAYAIHGAMYININQTSQTLWMCLECLQTELDQVGIGWSIEKNE